MKRLAALAVLVCLAVPASATAKTSASTGVFGFALAPVGPPGIFLVSGFISSPKAKCVVGAHRTVKLYAVYPDDSKVLWDTDTTSHRPGALGPAQATSPEPTGCERR